MMWIGLFTAANEARLLANITKVLPVAIAPRCGNDEGALVDAIGLIALAVSVREGLIGANRIFMSCRSGVGGRFRNFGQCELR
jgi:hypothetical protein